MHLDLTHRADEQLWAFPKLVHPDGPTRRRFLQGLLVAGGVTAAGLPTWLSDRSDASGFAARSIGATDGVVVVVTLLGGNDPLNTLAPIGGADRGRYQTLRPTLAIPEASLLPIGDGTQGLHPSLSRLADRYAAGTVALVRGVGTNGDFSHFTTQDTLMAGTATTKRTTGWLGRYADGLDDWQTGFRGVAVGSTVPLHLVGTRAEVTALPSSANLWGTDTSTKSELAGYAAVRAMAASPTGLGAMADAAAAAVVDSIDRAGTVTALCSTGLPTAPLARDLTLAARTINADLGTRCITVCRQGWDTHARQLPEHANLLAELDDALEVFFTQLDPTWHSRVTVLVVSEFGRRAAENSGAGTDHGAAGLAMVVGDNVRGGLYGANPSLTTLDAAGALVPTVDVRSVYASILGPWLDGDATGTLGAGYPDLGLFAAGPGQSPSG